MSDSPLSLEELSEVLLVDSTGQARLHYEACHLPLQGEGLINIIPIVFVGDKLLAAVPQEVWSRIPSERTLPKGGLVRAVLIETAAAFLDKPEEAVEDRTVTVWIGCLDPRLCKKIFKGRAEEALADVFQEEVEGEILIPFAVALAEVAEEHFAFQTAGEEPAAPVRRPALRRDDPLERRFQMLEESMSQIQASLANLNQAGEGGAGKKKDNLGARPKPKSRAPERGEKEEDIPGLDPGVVHSAREAGIPESQLRTLGKLLGKPNRMGDVPGTGVKPQKPKKPNVLSESEEEEEDAPEGEEAEAEAEEDREGGPAIQKAIVKLTEIVGSITKDRKGSKDVEAFLDNLGESTEIGGSSGSSGKSKSAAYKKLRSCLRENPSYLYTCIEELMEEDFMQIRRAPGSGHQVTSSRAWIEHRSRVLNYPNTIRFVWMLGGIHDCLKAGAYQEARTRTALAIAATDQAALDAGSWVLAQELLLEHAAPFASFQNKKGPEVWAQTTSKLVEDRWLDVMMWKLKDKDSYLESRRRLGQGKGRGPAGQESPNIESPGPKKQPKPGKGAKKDGGKGTAGEASGLQS